MSKASRKEILLYITLLLFTFFIFFLVYRFWLFGLKYPFDYTSDMLWALEEIKTVAKHGWIYVNPDLGAPYSAKLFDYPFSDLISLAEIKFLSFFTVNPFSIANLFILISFVLTSCSALFVFRNLKISPVLAFLGSLLFSFLPYHLLRSRVHIFLANYFIIPVSVLLLLKLFRKEINFTKSTFLPLFLLAFIIASSGIYYALYSCLFISVTGFYCFMTEKKLKAFAVSGLMILLISLGILINILPSLVYRFRHGPNPEATSTRSALDSVVYGLNISRLVIPIRSYHLAGFKNFNLDRSANTASEASEYLGFFGVAGFLFLILALVNSVKNESVLRHLSILNLTAVLYGVANGFGTVFSYLISNVIRANSRISPFIAFFSIIALLFVFDSWLKKADLKLRNTAFSLIVLFAVLSLFDQVSWFSLPFNQIKAELDADREFVAEIEADQPGNSLIFQLPYKPFPETVPIFKLADYDLFKPYLNSTRLRFSYGSIKGREEDDFQSTLISQPIGQMTRELRAVGFRGIYVDRFGYPDNAASLEAELTKTLSEKPLISGNQRLTFFSLSDKNLIPAQKNKYLPLRISWLGCSFLEQNGKDSWRWCDKKVKLAINNPGKERVTIDLSYFIRTGNQLPAKLSYSQGTGQRIVGIGLDPVNIRQRIEVPPGNTFIQLETDAGNPEAHSDYRPLTLLILNFKFFEVTSR